MNRAFRLASFAILTLVFATGAWFSLPSSVHAQVTEGLTAVGATVRLGTADPRVIAARVINAFLGLLGIIFLGLTLYAGFLWMTSGGDPTKTGSAMTMLRNAVIGLIIILSSWAITQYVITRLLEATMGGRGGSTVDDGSGGDGRFGGGGAFSNFQLRSITPAGSIPIRNVRVHFVFSRAVDPVVASSTIHVYRASGRVPVEGTLHVSGAVVEFIPSAVCPTAPTERCLDGDTNFIASVDRGLRSLATPGEISQRIICGGLALGCEASFRTGNLIDTQPPTATILIPFDGQSITQDDLLAISTRATDDTAISYVSSSVNNLDLGADAPTSTVREFFATIPWSTHGAATGTYALRSQASDMSGHNAFSSGIGLSIRPPHCSNRRQDADEAAIDCGGADCAMCVAGPGGITPRPAHCSNLTRDADEAAIDCGGSDCAMCVADPRSITPRPAHCSNLTRDADEVAVDCGGSDCAMCVADPRNITSPRPAHCSNLTRDADEAAIDCGGSDCAMCVAIPVTGQPCGIAAECRNPDYECRAGTCVVRTTPLHCSNGTRDTTLGEVGVDCGGTCPAVCRSASDVGSQCSTTIPCSSGYDCRAGVCVVHGTNPPPGHCSNGTPDTALGEIGVDCGGTCPAICVPVSDVVLTCRVAADCPSGQDCRAGVCVARGVVPPPPPGPRCSATVPCPSGFVCNASDMCVARGVVPPPPPGPRCPVGTIVLREIWTNNGLRDHDETGVDCGGSSAGACAHVSCTCNTECHSGVCSAGACVEQPIIQGFTPISGAPGTVVTITGANFGIAPGQVHFWNGSAFTVVASAPPASACASGGTWSTGQIIVQVPVGARDGAIQITNSSSGLSDTTTDEHGPVLPIHDFTVNATLHPGLCSVTPVTGEPGNAMTLRGIELGSSGQVQFGTYPSFAASSWNETRVEANVPVVPAARHLVRVIVDGQESNTVSFTVTERARSVPVLDPIDPAFGPVGEYITLTGRDFGTTAGRVMFRNARDGIGGADVSFPDACPRDFWHDTTITVKVPSTIGLSSPVTSGQTYDVFVRPFGGRGDSNSVPFMVNNAQLSPGICAVSPSAGPVGTAVTLTGERFGESRSGGTLTFQGSTPMSRIPVPVTAGAIPIWTRTSITTSVPAGAETGPIRVAVGTANSNGVRFAVGNCRNEPDGFCGTQHCCRDSGLCSVRDLCEEATTSTMFGWELSTGRLPMYPQVIEECPGPGGLPPSPSPWDARSGGSAICVNAEVVVRFNTEILSTTLTDRTVIVSRCTATGENPCATKVPVRTTNPFEIGISDGTASSRRTIVTISPLGEVGTGSDWLPNTTYDVALTTGVTSIDGTHMRSMERCERGNGYCFRFKTGSAFPRCVIGSVSVTPNPFTATELDEVIVPPYAGNALSTDVCVQINRRGLAWRWFNALHPSLADTRALLTPYSGATCTEQPGGICGWLENVTPHIPAGPTDPVRVNAAASNPGTVQSETTGAASLIIQPTPPRVISHGPDCNEACSDATIWAEFNVSMDPAYATTRQVFLYKCATENCRSFLPSTPLVLAPGSVTLIDSIMSSVQRPANRRLRIAPLDVDDPSHSYLEPGAFYKIILLADAPLCGMSGQPACVGGLRSSSGLALTVAAPNNDPRGFAWRFRVKDTNHGLCDVTRVDVVPLEKVEAAVAARQLFSATPISVSEACGEQYLMGNGAYAWSTSAPDVSKLVNGQGDGLVSTVPILSPNCSGRCLNMGSEGVFGHIASCGNSIVETTDAHTCQKAISNTSACASGDIGCVVRTDPTESCTVLSTPGSQGGEECDFGSARNGARDELCGANCLWTGVVGGTCGNARIDIGEQCDPALLSAPRPGCSDHCLALGSSSVTVSGASSRCDNRTVGDGETCDDGNTTDGDGCSSDCLHEGSHLVSAICGNGIPEPGESCEKVNGHWPAGCNYTTCLHEGTDACTLSSPTQAMCCGNNVLDAGEECDGGQDCSSHCLFAGSSIGYRPNPSICGDTLRGTGEQCDAPVGGALTGGRQVSEIVGTHAPDPTTGLMTSRLGATYRNKMGQASHGLQCGFTHEMECTIASYGLTTNGCCMERPTVTNARFPLPDARNVCRNTEISFNFSQVMDGTFLRDNVIIGEEVASDVACPSGTTVLSTVYKHTCIGGVIGTIRAEPAGSGGTRVIFGLTHALSTSTQYRIVVRGDENLSDDVRNGARNARGVLMDGDTTWLFTTGEAICLASDVILHDTDAVHPFLFKTSTEAHLFSASIMSTQLQGGNEGGETTRIIVPISSVTEYSWTWQPWISSRTPILTVTDGETPAAEQVTQRTNTATVSAHNRNGSSFIFAGILITRDDVSVVSTRGQTLETSHIATVSLCERPWPFVDARYNHAVLFSDSNPHGEPSVLTRADFVDGPYYNFATNYCMDAGLSASSTDDLPALTIRPTPPPSAAPADAAALHANEIRGLLRQYLFTFEGDGIADVLRKDAIGMRIFSNPLHLSPRAWYAAQGFVGAPASASVDGYEAVRDGDNIYVGAPNVNDSTAGQISSTVYFFSHNPDAEPATRTIFDQLVENLVFNVNIEHESSNVCKYPSSVVFEDVRHHTVPCSSDWECAKQDETLHCASFKAKIQRDIQRLADFQTFMTKLEVTRARDGRYPTITDGSYLQGLTNSRWGSWQSVLGAAIGGNPPIDPVNRFLTCGHCQYAASPAVIGEPCIDAADCRAGGTCVGISQTRGSTKVYDPSTCWEVVNRRFLCPVLPTGPSRFYQYRSFGMGAGYELGTELEAAPSTRYNPPLVTGLKHCTNTGQLCLLPSDCIIYYPGTTTEQSRGTCQPTGGQWRYENVCTGREFGVDTVCGNGIRSASEACEVGDTVLGSCWTVDHRLGMKRQICAPDCHSFTDVLPTSCIQIGLCGNGRVDRFACLDPGMKFGQACLTPTTGTSAECSDSRDAVGGGPTRCLPMSSFVGAGREEVCDDGAALNGTYGHCNLTCTGRDDNRCGDGQLNLGETCDNGTTNGQYCDSRSATAVPPGANCVVADSCGFDCHSPAPFCGDHIVQEGSGEQCELEQSHTSTDAVCNSYSFAASRLKKTCQSDADCGGSGFTRPMIGHLCGPATPGNPPPLQNHYLESSCANYSAYRCIGSGHICEGTSAGGDRRRCNADADCATAAAGGGGSCVARELVNCEVNRACGPGGRCNPYPTQRTQVCGPVDASAGVPAINQCQWARWSACLPAASCGDGVRNVGEECDDGNDVDNDACTSQCQTNVCGDGYLNVGVERCDYGSQARGGRNGLPCTSEYGATCATCTTSCHVEAQSGGFCGDGLLGGREQCDYVGECVGGTSAGARCTSHAACVGGRCNFPGVTSDATCRSIGYDYANDSVCDTHAYITRSSDGRIECVNAPSGGECTLCDTSDSVILPGCDLVLRSLCPTEPVMGVVHGSFCRRCPGGNCVNHPALSAVPVTVVNQAICRAGTIHDRLSCATSCSFAGCGSCLVAPSPENAVTIEGAVFDIFAQVPIPGARIILTYRGNRITDTVADAEGHFSIPNLHGRQECAQYRLVVSAERDNPRTLALETFGYRAFDSGAFSPLDFEMTVTPGGRIDLTPRTGTDDTGASSGGSLPNETQVDVTWNGLLPTFTLTGEAAGTYVRAILPHVILPGSRSFTKYPPTTDGNDAVACNGERQMYCSALGSGYDTGYVGSSGAQLNQTIGASGADGLLCSDDVSVFSLSTGPSRQFACGYLFTSNMHATVNPLRSSNPTRGTDPDAVLCCPSTNTTFPTPTPAGITAIAAGLRAIGGTSFNTPVHQAEYLQRACCIDHLGMAFGRILGYATSTSCVATDLACPSNASASINCCRRDIGSGATWQGSDRLSMSPGAVASCRLHHVTTHDVCNAYRAATAVPGQGPQGALTKLACDLNTSCDEFVREADRGRSMRVRYVRSMAAGETYGFYLEQAHYAEEELSGAAGVFHRCYARAGPLAPGQSEYTNTACSGDLTHTVVCPGGTTLCSEVLPPRSSTIRCTGTSIESCGDTLRQSDSPTSVEIHTLASTSIRAPWSTPARLFNGEIYLQVAVRNGTAPPYTILPPPQTPRPCANGISPYLWHVFDQDARTGVITIAGDGRNGEWMCDPPDGMLGLNRSIRDSSYNFLGSAVMLPPDFSDSMDYSVW